MDTIELTNLHIYPLKSTAPIDLTQAQVGTRGLALDRHWMLVDSQGLFITGRKYPQLTLLKTQVLDTELQISGPNMPMLRIPLKPTQYQSIQVRVWQDACTAWTMGAHYDTWFSQYLATPCTLVCMHEQFNRATHPDYSQPGDQVSFADGFPILLTTQASLNAVNQHLASPVPMGRFRPNIVIQGCEAFAEDRWKTIQIGTLLFDVVKPCSRCVFTTVDPTTGTRDTTGEPFKTLSSLRKREDGKTYFGQNLIPRSLGQIRLGDTVKVLIQD